MKRIQIVTLIAFAMFSATGSANAEANEAKALAVLASDADTHTKAMACDTLGRVGTGKAVPALSELLGDEKLSDYARDGLERIPDPAAGKALLEALKTLKGNLLVGVIISLGDRSEIGAVPALAKIAKESEGQAAGAALASLAQIANDDAANAILEVLAKAGGEVKESAALAALAAAGRMESDGNEDGAKKLRAAVLEADVPGYLKGGVK